jgi:hypothetical protein
VELAFAGDAMAQHLRQNLVEVLNGSLRTPRDTSAVDIEVAIELGGSLKLHEDELHRHIERRRVVLTHVLEERSRLRGASRRRYREKLEVVEVERRPVEGAGRVHETCTARGTGSQDDKRLRLA